MDTQLQSKLSSNDTKIARSKPFTQDTYDRYWKEHIKHAK